MPAVEGVGSGWLCTDLDLLGATEPVTSLEGACARELKGSVKRVDSELQLTANSEIAATMAGRDHGSERRGSTTQRIGGPTQYMNAGHAVKHRAGK
jgi:hypothetical protein